VERIRVRIDRRADRRAWAALGAAPFEFYDPVDDWQARLHESIGEPWPCAAASRFDEVWAELEALFASSGLRRRRASYGGWGDADPYFARGVWCAVAHRQPAVVVETGVAHGVTTRVVLEALAEQREGALWSIDLPAVDPALHHQIAVAVPQDLRTRWTYVPGTSRERLPALIVELGQVGVFIHDSLHTGRNTRFELESVWPALAPGGVAVVDDIDHSTALDAFARANDDARVIAAVQHDGVGLCGAAVKHWHRRDGGRPGTGTTCRRDEGRCGACAPASAHGAAGGRRDGRCHRRPGSRRSDPARDRRERRSSDPPVPRPGSDRPRSLGSSIARTFERRRSSPIRRSRPSMSRRKHFPPTTTPSTSSCGEPSS
jgi:hypothetical protein